MTTCSSSSAARLEPELVVCRQGTCAVSVGGKGRPAGQSLVICCSFAITFALRDLELCRAVLEPLNTGYLSARRPCCSVAGWSPVSTSSSNGLVRPANKDSVAPCVYLFTSARRLPRLTVVFPRDNHPRPIRFRTSGSRIVQSIMHDRVHILRIYRILINHTYASSHFLRHVLRPNGRTRILTVPIQAT